MTLKRHSLSLGGHRTSVALEDAFWNEIRRIAAERGISIAGLVAEVDAARAGEEPPPNLGSALRLFVLADLKSRARD
jgi:predicted DNA-binding ribbon-helix-helix protein